MPEERIQRRLAAILSADVVAYSRLMGDNETDTLSALKSHRLELIDPSVEEYGGRIVKLMGVSIPTENCSLLPIEIAHFGLGFVPPDAVLGVLDSM